MTSEKNFLLLHHKILTRNFSVPRQNELNKRKKKCSRFFTENSVFCVYLQGGEVVQETITSNIHDDIITLEFQRTDGTLITQLIDFRSVSIANLFLLFLLFCFRKGQTPTLGPVLAPRNKLNLNVFIMIWMKVWIKFLFCFLLSSVFVDPRMKQRRKKNAFPELFLSIVFPWNE